MEIEFKIFHKKGKGLGVELPDGTIILIDNEHNGLRIAFPKIKFEKLFKKQKKWKYYEVLFTKEEIEMLLKALYYKSQKSTTKPKMINEKRMREMYKLNDEIKEAILNLK